MGGKRKKKSSESLASLQLLESNPELVNMTTFFTQWCQKQNLCPNFELSCEGEHPKVLYKSDLTVQGYELRGHGEANKRKDANFNAARDYVSQLVQHGILKREECPEINVESEEELKINGGWNEDNAKYRLNTFFLDNNISMKYDCHPAGDSFNCHSGFICEMSSHIPQIDKDITGVGKGCSKSVASRKCAVSMVRQLYHLNLIESYSSIPTKKTVKQKLRNKSSNLELELPSNLQEEIDSTLQCFNITPSTCKREGKDSVLLICKKHDDDVEVPPHPPPVFNSVIKLFPFEENYNTWTSSHITDGSFYDISLHQSSLKLQKNYQDRSSSDSFKARLETRKQMPIHAHKQAILDAIFNNPVVIVKGSTNSGKTTQVCQYILDHYLNSGFGSYCNVIVTEPNSVYVNDLARQVAAQRDEELGDSVGYAWRYVARGPRPFGAICFCTAEVFIRKMEKGLKGISHIIIDEFHQRDMRVDLLLIILKDMVEQYPDLRIIIITTPSKTSPLIQYFNNPPVIEIEASKSFPIQDFFLEDFVEKSGYEPPLISWRISRKFKKSKPDAVGEEDEEEQEKTGSSSAFAPLPEIYSASTKKAMEILDNRRVDFHAILGVLRHIEGLGVPGNVLIIFAEMPPALAFKSYAIRFIDASKNLVFMPLFMGQFEQEQKITLEPAPAGTRKVILATSAVETFYALKNLVYVIDTCQEKMALISRNRNRIAFASTWASKENLALRRARLGKTNPGYYYYMCSKARYDSLEEHFAPEMQRLFVHDVGLYVKLLGLGSIKKYLAKALDPPSEDFLAKAEDKLKERRFLGANNEMTDIGMLLCRLPIEPRKGKMLLLACALSLGDQMTTLVASNCIRRDLFLRKPMSSARRAAAGQYYSDHILILDSFHLWEEAKMAGDESEASFCQENFINSESANNILHMKKHLKEILEFSGIPKESFSRRTSAQPVGFHRIIIGLLTLGSFPNVIHNTRLNKLMLKDFNQVVSFDPSSVMNRARPPGYKFPSPLFIFERKTKARVVGCKCVTMVSPLHLLLFGSDRVESCNDDVVKLDDWLRVDMSPVVANKIVSLRPVVQYLLEGVAGGISFNKINRDKYTKGVDCLRKLLLLEFDQERPLTAVSQAWKLPRGGQCAHYPAPKRRKIEIHALGAPTEDFSEDTYNTFSGVSFHSNGSNNF